MKNKTIGVFVGSLRKQSYSRKIAEIVSAMMPGNIEMRRMDIGNLSIFNQDFDDENNTPEEWTVFRNSLRPLDGFLFVTPEYNRSMPPVLKNAIDIGSKPYGHNLWNGKPGGIVSVSTGGISGFGANHHLRQSLVFLNVYTMQQPEAYIGNVDGLLDDAGALKEEGTRSFLQSFADEFVNWIKVFDD